MGFDIPIRVRSLKGNPTVLELLYHVRREYPLFWEKVFSSLERQLLFLRHIASAFLLVYLMIIAYSLCFCCYRPYNFLVSSGSYEVEREEIMEDRKEIVEERHDVM